MMSYVLLWHIHISTTFRFNVKQPHILDTKEHSVTAYFLFDLSATQSQEADCTGTNQRLVLIFASSPKQYTVDDHQGQASQSGAAMAGGSKGAYRKKYWQQTCKQLTDLDRNSQEWALCNWICCSRKGRVSLAGLACDWADRQDDFLWMAPQLILNHVVS